MADYPKTNPKDVRDAVHVADPAIDAVTPPGVMVKATRTVLDKMVGQANEAITKQQNGGSTPTK